MSKRNKLARILQAPARGIKNWLAPQKRNDVEKTLDLTNEQLDRLLDSFRASGFSLKNLETGFVQMAEAMTRTQARRAGKSQFMRAIQTVDGISTISRAAAAGAISAVEMSAAMTQLSQAFGGWDMSHRPGEHPIVAWDIIDAQDPEAWARRVAAAGDIIEEHRITTGRDLSGYEELFAAPVIETRDVVADQMVVPEPFAGSFWDHIQKIFDDQIAASMQVEADRILNGDGSGRPSGIIVNIPEGVYTAPIHIDGDMEITGVTGAHIQVSGNSPKFVMLDEFAETKHGFRPLTRNRK